VIQPENRRIKSDQSTPANATYRAGGKKILADGNAVFKGKREETEIRGPGMLPRCQERRRHIRFNAIVGKFGRQRGKTAGRSIPPSQTRDRLARNSVFRFRFAPWKSMAGQAVAAV
jgi:hypothetical protein